jgi:hypothetical protein
VNRGQSRTRFKASHLGAAYASGSHHPAQPFFAHLERGVAGKDRLIAASALASKRRLAFSLSLPSAKSAARRDKLPAHSA